MTRKLVVEAIGTFFLVLTVGQVVLEPGAGALAPLAIGAVLTALVYAGGHISGAHYNPAVTLGVVLRGRATWAELGGYWAAQLLGAVFAAATVGALKGDVMVATLAPTAGSLILAEFLFTFALVFVILNVATAKGTEGNSYFGLAIGITVAAGAFAVGPVSGGVFNPAVAIGTTMLGITGAGSLLLYFGTQLLAGAAAALVFTTLDLGDDKPTTATAAEQAGLRGAAEPQ